jgi:hypothetical protein
MAYTLTNTASDGTGAWTVTNTPSDGSYTVGNLPSAATAGVGARAFVTDGSTTLILGLGLTVLGSGSNKVPVYSDGSNWKIG